MVKYMYPKMKQFGYIYELYDPRADMYYIGQRRHEFNPKYKGSGTNLGPIIRARSTVRQIESCRSQKDIDSREVVLIDAYTEYYRKDKMYNIAPGGSGGGCGPHSKATKEKMRILKLGKKVPALQGQKRSQEAKDKMSDSATKRWLKRSERKKQSERRRGSKPWNTGKKLGPLSEELKLRLSILHRGQKPWNTGKHLSEEHKKAVGRPGKSNSFYGKTHTKEALQKMSTAKKNKPWSTLRRKAYELSKL